MFFGLAQSPYKYSLLRKINIKLYFKNFLSFIYIFIINKKININENY